MISAILKLLGLLLMIAGLVLSFMGDEYAATSTLLIIMGLLPTLSFHVAKLIRVPISDTRRRDWLLLLALIFVAVALFFGRL